MTLHDLLQRVPVLAPGAAAALGVLLLGWGARLWRISTIIVGLGLGAALGLRIGVAVGDTTVGYVAAGALAIGLCVAFYMVERLAFAGLGAAGAVALLGVVWPMLRHGDPSLPVELGVGAVGLLLGGLLHQRAVQVATALAGAGLVAWALGREGNIYIVLPLAVLGALVQFGVLGGGGGSAAPARKGKKKE